MDRRRDVEKAGPSSWGLAAPPVVGYSELQDEGAHRGQQQPWAPRALVRTLSIANAEPILARVKSALGGTPVPAARVPRVYGLSERALRHRRCARLVWWLLAVCSLGAVLWLVHLPLKVIQIEKDFDPRRALVLDVYGCDVRVLSVGADEPPQLQLRGIISTTRVSWSFNEHNLVHYARASSTADCRKQPFMQCSESCLLAVRVPEGVVPFELHVNQLSNDPNPWVQLRVTNVTLGTLRVRGPGGQYWAPTGPTLDAALRAVTIRKALYVTLAGGSLRCDQCDIDGAADVDVRSSGGTIAIDAVLPDSLAPSAIGGAELLLNIRQPMNYLCVAAEIPSVPLPPPSPPAARPPAPPGSAPEPRPPPPPAVVDPYIAPSADPWQLCRSQFYLEGASAFFDPNGDRFVDRSEFLSALLAIPYCCGATSCPYGTYCDPVAWKLFPTTTGSTDASFGGRAGVLSNSAFLGQVMAYNYTGFVPQCRQRLTVTQPPPAELDGPDGGASPAARDRHSRGAVGAAAAPSPAACKPSRSHVCPVPPPPPPPPPPATWTAVDATGGQVHISLRARNSTWERAASGRGASTAWPPLWPAESAHWYSPANKYGGIRMLHADAMALQKEVGPRYGDLGSTEHAYIVFDVPAAPGVPRSLWVYATAPVFHILDPATLAHLSLGTLVPTLLRYRVRFHNADCDENLTRGEVVRAACSAVYMLADQLDADSACTEVVYSDHDARLAAVHAGLSRAIKSDGKDTRRARGQVLLVGSEERGGAFWSRLGLGPSYELFDFQLLGAETPAKSALGSTTLSTVLHIAVLMSMLSALVVAAGAEWALYLGARALMVRVWKAQRSRLRVLQNKGLAMELADGVSAYADRADMSGDVPSFNVFAVPLVFISAVFVAPLRRRHTHSLRAFVRHACELDGIAAAKAAQGARRRAGLAPGGGGGAGGGAGGAGAPAGAPASLRPTTPFADLVDAFETFCFQRDLDIEMSRDALQRALIADFGCRVSVYPVKRYCGLRWRDGAPPLPPAPPPGYAAAGSGCGGAFEDACSEATASPSTARAARGARAPHADPPAAAAGGGAAHAQPAPAAASACTPLPVCTGQLTPTAAAAAAMAVPPAEGAAGAQSGSAALPAAAPAELHAAAGRPSPSRRSASFARPAGSHADAGGSHAGESEAAANFLSGKEDVKQFVSERLELAGATVFVPADAAESAGGPASGAGAERSFGPELRLWCEARGAREPTELEVLHALAELGVRCIETRARTVHGLVLSEGPRDEASVGLGRFGAEALTVLVHFWLLVLPSMAVLCTAVYAQAVFSRTTATRQPLLWQYAFRTDMRGMWWTALFDRESAQILPSVRYEIVEMVVFVYATMLHMGLHYADLSLGPRMIRAKRLLDSAYAVLLCLHVLLLLLRVTLNLTWCILASIVDPDRLLPAGTAVVVSIVVVISTKRELSAAASALRSRLSAAFETRLQSSLRRALAAIEAEKQGAQLREIGLTRAELLGTKALVLGDEAEVSLLKPPAAAGALAGAGGGGGGGADGLGAAAAAGAVAEAVAVDGGAGGGGRLLPSDVFGLLTREMDDPRLSLEEFSERFSKLDLQLSDARKEQLFAYMDVSGDGRIDQREFDDGWDFLVAQMIDEAADSMGVSEARIALSLLALILWLVFLFLFIFLAVQGWFSQGSFQATIQSLFICVSGGITKALRKKTSGESKTSIDELVASILSSDRAAPNNKG